MFYASKIDLVSTWEIRKAGQDDFIKRGKYYKLKKPNETIIKLTCFTK